MCTHTTYIGTNEVVSVHFAASTEIMFLYIYLTHNVTAHPEM